MEICSFVNNRESATWDACTRLSKILVSMEGMKMPCQMVRMSKRTTKTTGKTMTTVMTTTTVMKTTAMTMRTVMTMTTTAMPIR